MTHPLDRRKRNRPDPKTHHAYTGDHPVDPAAVSMTSAWLLLGPSLRAFMLNLPEVAKLLGMALLPGLIGAICGYIGYEHKGTTTQAIFNGLSGVGIAVMVGLLIAIMPAYGLIQLKSARREIADFRDEFIIGLPLIWRFLGATIIANLAIFAGFILFVVPGIFALQRYLLAPYYVLDREMTVKAALQAAGADARRYSRPMWSLAILTLFGRVVAFVLPPYGFIAAGLLQVGYAYTPAIRYTELKEANRQADKK